MQASLKDPPSMQFLTEGSHAGLEHLLGTCGIFEAGKLHARLHDAALLSTILAIATSLKVQASKYQVSTRDHIYAS